MQFNEKNILIRHLTSFIEIDNYSDYKNMLRIIIIET